MKTNYCTTAGKSHLCASCKYAPENQLGQPRGPTISPPVRKDGKCVNYVGYIKPRSNA